MKKYIFSILLAILFLGCEKKVEILSSFPFEINSIYQREVILNVQTPLQVDIVPEQVVKTNKYLFSYRILSGNANFFLDTGESLREEVETPLNKLGIDLLITPTSVGDVEIQITITDQKETIETRTILFNVIDRSFGFSVSSNLSSIPIGDPLTLNYIINEESGPDEDNYTMTFSTDSNGTLTVNSIEYSAGEEISIPSLSFRAIYRPSSPGSHKITSNITAVSNKLKVTKEVNVEVLPSDFEFNVASLSEVIVGQSIDFVFNINELSGDSDFDISYAITGVSGEFRNVNNVVLNPNTDYDVENTFIWKLKGVVQGTSNITFTVKNQFGVERQKNITINILPISFDFNVQPIGSSFELGRNIVFAFQMTAPNSLTYEISFSANTKGTIITPGQTILNENQFSTINNGEFNITYIPQLAGTAVINFTIRASNGVQITKQIPFLINEDPVIESIEVINSGGSGCAINSFKARIKIFWSKPATVSIVSVNIFSPSFANFNKNYNLSLNETNNDTDEFLELSCFSNFFLGRPIELQIYITDSRGVRSRTFIETITIN